MSEWADPLAVELPLSTGLTFAGIRTAALFVVSTTTIAALAGFSGSLGDVIADESSYRFAGVLGAAICVAGLALTVDLCLARVQRLLTPRGLRLEAAADSASGRRRSRGSLRRVPRPGCETGDGMSLIQDNQEADGMQIWTHARKSSPRGSGATRGLRGARGPYRRGLVLLLLALAATLAACGGSSNSAPSRGRASRR